MVIKENYNGCEVRIFFKPQAEDIKDKVLWLILECFKSRLKKEKKAKGQSEKKSKKGTKC